MTKDEFLAMVARETDTELVVVTRPANAALDHHAHPFGAVALVLRGAITIAQGGPAQLYRSGDVFQIPAGREHVEHYGEHGVTYLVARSG